MRRLFCLVFLNGILACDPSLDVPKTNAAPEGGPPAAPPTTPPSESDAGPSDGGDEASDGGTDASTTHVVDGVNDFAPGEKLTTTSHTPTSSSDYFAYVAWDAKNLYFGMEGADVAASTSNAASKWVMLYLGAPGVTGSTTGLSYGGQQQPTLPFPAAWHLRFKIDGSYTNVQKWNGSAFVDAGIEIILTAVRTGSFLEMSIPRASIGGPAMLDVHFNMLIEGGNSDWTYAGAPSTSFTDMKNPSFGKYFELDLANTAKAPSSYTPKP